MFSIYILFFSVFCMVMVMTWFRALSFFIVSLLHSLKNHFRLMKDSHTHRERERKRQTETERKNLPFTGSLLNWLRCFNGHSLDRLKPWSLELHLDLPHSWQGSRQLNHPLVLFPGCIPRGLDRKWSNQDSNCHVMPISDEASPAEYHSASLWGIEKIKGNRSNIICPYNRSLLFSEIQSKSKIKFKLWENGHRIGVAGGWRKEGNTEKETKRTSQSCEGKIHSRRGIR